MKNISLLLVSVLLAFSACHKSGNGQAFTFVNNSSDSLNVSMYASASDRDNDIKALFSFTVPASGKYEISESKFNSSMPYYFLVHTADYHLSNWAGTDSTYTISSRTDHQLDLSVFHLTAAQYYYMRGQSTTSWSAFNAVDFVNKSSWNALSATERYHELVLNRDRTGYIMYQLTNGSIATDTINITSTWELFGITLLDLSSSVYGTNFSTTYNSAKPLNENFIHPPSLDTLILNYKSKLWVMVRH